MGRELKYIARMNAFGPVSGGNYHDMAVGHVNAMAHFISPIF